MRSRTMLTALALTAFSATARAGQTASPKSEEGYGYEFADDPLVAGGFGP